MTDQQIKEEFQQIEDNFNRAIISNDIEEIKKCISEDWELIDTQSGTVSREKFLHVVESGLLSHSTMTKELLAVRVYDSIAVVIGRGRNTGTWQGKPMRADEWVTDIYKKEGNRWLCVLTHLVPATNNQTN